jgi:hypothetical protein
MAKDKRNTTRYVREHRRAIIRLRKAIAKELRDIAEERDGRKRRV